jgi:transcription elongation factor GreA
MNNDLAIAEQIDAHQVPTDRVGVGSRVTLRDVADGSQRVMTFLGPFDTDVEEGIFNYRAPLSLQLMGLGVGERTRLKSGDRELEYEVVAVACGLPVAQAAPQGQTSEPSESRLGSTDVT